MISEPEMLLVYLTVYSLMFKWINNGCTHLHNFAKRKLHFQRQQAKRVLKLTWLNWVQRRALSRNMITMLMDTSVEIWYHQSIFVKVRIRVETYLQSHQEMPWSIYTKKECGWLYLITPCLLRSLSPNRFYFKVILESLKQKNVSISQENYPGCCQYLQSPSPNLCL